MFIHEAELFYGVGAVYIRASEMIKSSVDPLEMLNMEW